MKKKNLYNKEEKNFIKIYYNNIYLLNYFL